MQGTLSIFPSNRKVLDSIHLPFVIYVSPIPDDLTPFQLNEITIPRCSNPQCSAFFNGLCLHSSKNWTCIVCGTCSSFKADQPLPASIYSVPSYQIVDPTVSFPLTHVVIIGCGDISPARVIMQCLPPEASVQVFVMNTLESARKLVTTAGNSVQLRKLPETSIQGSIATTLPLLSTLLNAKKSCFWCRVFCSCGSIDDHTIEKLNQFDRIPIRIDYFVGGQLPSTFRDKLPGICRVFESFENPRALNSASEIAASDCARKFGFQCKVNLKCGPNFTAACDGERPTLPVIGSSRAAIPFNIRLQKQAPVGFQAIQVLAHVHLWDPPTNTLKKCTNVLNGDFAVSDDISRILSSASSSALFDYFARHNQLSVIDSLGNFEILKPLTHLYRRGIGSNFQTFSNEIFDLCPPTVWRFVLGVFADLWISEGEIQAVILKIFPNLYFAVREGKDGLFGNTIREFVDLCRPLSVNVHQGVLSEILQRIDELTNVIVVKH
jgi:hypothetical protein